MVREASAEAARRTNGPAVPPSADVRSWVNGERRLDVATGRVLLRGALEAERLLAAVPPPTVATPTPAAIAAPTGATDEASESRKRSICRRLSASSASGKGITCTPFFSHCIRSGSDTSRNAVANAGRRAFSSIRDAFAQS